MQDAWNVVKYAGGYGSGGWQLRRSPNLAKSLVFFALRGQQIRSVRGAKIRFHQLRPHGATSAMLSATPFRYRRSWLLMNRLALRMRLSWLLTLLLPTPEILGHQNHYHGLRALHPTAHQVTQSYVSTHQCFQ